MSTAGRTQVASSQKFKWLHTPNGLFIFRLLRYIYFSCKFRDNLPLQVSFSEQSPEIKSVLSCILKKRGNWILVLGGRRGEGRRREVQEEGKRHRFPESSSCFLPSPPLHFFPVHSYPIKTKPSSGLDTPSSFPGPHCKGAHSSSQNEGPAE